MISYLNELQTAIKATNWASVDTLAEELSKARAIDSQVFTCGNGGSYAVALHWGVDLPKIAHVNVHTLGANQSLGSALANDLDYEVALSTELLMRAQVGDIVIAMSCSGISSNIQSVLSEAVKMHLECFLLTGCKAPEYPGVKLIRIVSENYGILEDVFSAIGHYLTQELSQ